jgi:hypothetical protein
MTTRPLILTLSLMVVSIPAVSGFSPVSRSNALFNKPATSIAELFAVPTPSASGSWGPPRGVSSKTARETATLVEWEPMTELERRIEDGVHYEHMPSRPNANGKSRKNKSKAVCTDSPSVRGIFVGYRATSEEYDRLKCADPTQ